MPEHGWPDDSDDPNAFTVRHVQPYEAVKAYRCPGCDLDIRPGAGHEVVVPTRDPTERRHWHTGCWRQAEKRLHRSAP
jgi:hypothetical protein